MDLDVKWSLEVCGRSGERYFELWWGTLKHKGKAKLMIEDNRTDRRLTFVELVKTTSTPLAACRCAAIYLFITLQVVRVG